MIFSKYFCYLNLRAREEVRRKRRRGGAYCGGAGMPLGFPCESSSAAAVITGRRRVRHVWGGGMMRLHSVWMGAGGSGVFSLRCRIGRNGKAMQRRALRRCSCGSGRRRRTASETRADRCFVGLCLADKSIAGRRGRSVRIRNRAGVGAEPPPFRAEPCAACRPPCAALLRRCVSGRGPFPMCRRGTFLPPDRARFGPPVFLLFFVVPKLN